MTKDRNDIELKPFTETLEIEDMKLYPCKGGGLFIEGAVDYRAVTETEARALYEYLKRHFEPQTKEVNREMLKRFVGFVNKKHGNQEGTLQELTYESQVIDEFLQSESERQP